MASYLANLLGDVRLEFRVAFEWGIRAGPRGLDAKFSSTGALNLV